MEQNLRFLLVLGWLAVLKTAKPNLSLATFEDKWRDGVHRNEIFEEIIPDFSTFSNFKKNIYIKAILCNFLMRLLKKIKNKKFKFFFDPQNMKKQP